jgi:hypothetical protein
MMMEMSIPWAGAGFVLRRTSESVTEGHGDGWETSEHGSDFVLPGIEWARVHGEGQAVDGHLYKEVGEGVRAPMVGEGNRIYRVRPSSFRRAKRGKSAKRSCAGSGLAYCERI